MIYTTCERQKYNPFNYLDLYFDKEIDKLMIEQEPTLFGKFYIREKYKITNFRKNKFIKDLRKWAKKIGVTSIDVSKEYMGFHFSINVKI